MPVLCLTTRGGIVLGEGDIGEGVIGLRCVCEEESTKFSDRVKPVSSPCQDRVKPVSSPCQDRVKLGKTCKTVHRTRKVSYRD